MLSEYFTNSFVNLNLVLGPHGFYPLPVEEGGSKRISTILRKGEFEKRFWREARQEGWSIFGGGFRVFRDSNHKFYFTIV